MPKMEVRETDQRRDRSWSVEMGDRDDSGEIAVCLKAIDSV